jgi:hypothetical protein
MRWPGNAREASNTTKNRAHQRQPNSQGENRMKTYEIDWDLTWDDYWMCVDEHRRLHGKDAEGPDWQELWDKRLLAQEPLRGMMEEQFGGAMMYQKDPEGITIEEAYMMSEDKIRELLNSEDILENFGIGLDKDCELNIDTGYFPKEDPTTKMFWNTLNESDTDCNIVMSGFPKHLVEEFIQKHSVALE